MVKNPPSKHEFRFDRSHQNIGVELWNPVDPYEAAEIVTAFYQSTWGDLDHPRRVDDPWLIAQMAMEGQVLPNTLESLALTFGIEGISRTTTHQLVRSRVGAVFGQQGGRDNNWSDFNFRIPPTLRPVDKDMLQSIVYQANELYKTLLEAGVPYQDARYVLPMGLETNLVASYNMLSLKGTLARRLCNRMAWEINWVARKMHDQVVQAFPWVGRSLRSSCEVRGTCQSVSPMFPPACQTWRDGVVFCEDNSTLKGMITPVEGYEFSIAQNGTVLTQTLDMDRIEFEANDPNLVMSLTEDKVLAKKVGREWHRAV